MLSGRSASVLKFQIASVQSLYTGVAYVGGIFIDATQYFQTFVDLSLRAESAIGPFLSFAGRIRIINVRPTSGRGGIGRRAGLRSL